MYNRFHRGEWITWASGGEGALDTPGPLNGPYEICYTQGHKNQWSIGTVKVNDVNPGHILFVL